MKVFVPDAQKGFYRATRFDWSGAIGDMEFAGHHIYHPWFQTVDPAVRDFLRARGIECFQAYGTADLGLVAYETVAREGLVDSAESPSRSPLSMDPRPERVLGSALRKGSKPSSTAKS